jgi:hypothetical protein
LTNLALESASGGSMILNEQQLLPGLGVTDDAFQKWLNEFETDWVPAGCRLRKPGLLRYNCHGLTFANRRSWISELSEIPKILHDDGYTQVRDEDVLPGDIVSITQVGGEQNTLELSLDVTAHKVFAYRLS